MGLDLVVEAIPVAFKGDTASSIEAMDNFCRSFDRDSQSYRSDFGYEETVVTKAYDSFDQCIKFAAQGVSIEHNVLSLESLDFFFRASVTSKPIKLSGVTTSPNVSCSGNLQGKLVKYGPDTVAEVAETLGFTCRRAPKDIDGGARLYDEGTVQVVTNFGNYSVYLPRDEQLSESQASVLARHLDAKLDKDQFPEGDYVILAGSGGCPTGFGRVDTAIKAIAVYAKEHEEHDKTLGTYIRPGAFGASSVACSGCGHANRLWAFPGGETNAAFTGELQLAACVRKK